MLITPTLFARRSINSKALLGIKKCSNSRKNEMVNKNEKLLINFLLFKL